jgi:hypothetical protein
MKDDNMKDERLKFDISGKRLPTNICPYCQIRLDAAGIWNGEDDRPSPGDFSVCLNCGEICAFTEMMGLRVLFPGELMEAPVEAGAAAITARQWIKMRGRIK